MGITKLKAIYDGFANYTFKSRAVEELAKGRAEICAECDFCIPQKVFKVLGDKNNKKIEGAGCEKCGCFLSAKIRSVFEKCPQGHW